MCQVCYSDTIITMYIMEQQSYKKSSTEYNNFFCAQENLLDIQQFKWNSRQKNFSLPSIEEHSLMIIEERRVILPL